MCILVLCVGQGEEGDFNHNMEIHNFIFIGGGGTVVEQVWPGAGARGVLELFFDGVSGPRSGTPTHI